MPHIFSLVKATQKSCSNLLLFVYAVSLMMEMNVAQPVTHLEGKLFRVDSQDWPGLSAQSRHAGCVCDCMCHFDGFSNLSRTAGRSGRTLGDLLARQNKTRLFSMHPAGGWPLTRGYFIRKQLQHNSVVLWSDFQMCCFNEVKSHDLQKEHVILNFSGAKSGG